MTKSKSKERDCELDLADRSEDLLAVPDISDEKLARMEHEIRRIKNRIKEKLHLVPQRDNPPVLGPRAKPPIPTLSGTPESSAYTTRNEPNMDLPITSMLPNEPPIGELKSTIPNTPTRATNKTLHFSSDRVHLDKPSTDGESSTTPKDLVTPAVFLRPVEPIPSALPKPNGTNAAWTGLNTLLDILSHSSDAFGPLKSAVAGLFKCIEIFEKEAKAREDYAELRKTLDGLCADITRFIRGNVPPVMTRSMTILAQDIQSETELVIQKERRGKIQGLAEAVDDADMVLVCYRRIQTHLARFALNSNMDVWKIASEHATNDLLNRLPDSPPARYSSAESRSLRRNACAPNTRVGVLHSLQSWAEGSDNQKIYWLNGMAGTGKTTIAYSLSESLDISGRLAATFFCSRQLPTCRDVNRIVPSIAYQLSLISRPFRHAVSSTLELDPEAYNHSLEEQLKRLIMKPLSVAEKALPINMTVAIDALDECEDQEGVAALLSALLAYAPLSPVKFFLTSRPYPRIVDKLDMQKVDEVRLVLRLHDLDRSIVQGDIRIFLANELSQLRLSPMDMEELVVRSGALFIYAATVTRYVLRGRQTERNNRLKGVMNRTGSSGSKSTQEIDQLYAIVLHAALKDNDLETWETETMLLTLRSIICAQEPLTVVALADILKLNDINLVQAALERMLSVLHVGGLGGQVTTLHESFPEFLQDYQRSGDFHCDLAEHHAWYARSCLDLISAPNPPFNICGLESSYLPDKEVPDIQYRIGATIPQSLFYACLYWETHTRLAKWSDKLQDLLWDFMSMRLLLWMEVMNLKRRMHDGAEMMHKLHQWMQKSSKKSKDLLSLCQEAWRFITVFMSSEISQYTPHLYISALPFWPASSLLSRCYMSRMSGLTKVTGPGLDQRRQAPISICKAAYEVMCIAISASDDSIASGMANGNVQVWNIHTGQPIGEPLQGHTASVWSVSFSPNKQWLASSSRDETIRLWDLATGRTMGIPLRGHGAGVHSVVFSPNSERIVSGSEDKTIRIWDALSGQLVGHPYQGHDHWVNSVAFSPDGELVVSGSSDQTIRIWDTRTGELVGQPLHGHDGMVRSVAFSPNGQYIVSGSDDKTIRIWSAQTGEMVGRPLQGHDDWIRSVSFSPDNQYIISGSDDKTIRIWDALSGAVVGQPLQGHHSWVYSVSFSSNGQLMVSGSDDCTIRIWDAPRTETGAEVHHGHENWVSSVAFSPNGERIVSGSGDGSIRIWDSWTGNMLGQSLHGHERWVNSVAFSPDGERVASGSGDETIRIWDTSTGQMIGQPLKGPGGSIHSVAFSPNGDRIISGSSNGIIGIWNTLSGEIVGRPLEGHRAYGVNSVAISPDGEMIASGSSDKTIQLWYTSTGEPLGHTFKGHSHGVNSVAFSPNGKHFVSGSVDGTVRIWDTLTGQMLGVPLQGHEDEVCCVAFSANGQYIASGSGDETIRIWDALTGVMIGNPLRGHDDWVRSVAFSPDGERIVSGSHDSVIRIWDARINNLSQGDQTPDSDWALDADGWVRNGSDLPLIWVPIELRHTILHPRNNLLISRDSHVQLDLSDAVFGPKWTRCYPCC